MALVIKCAVCTVRTESLVGLLPSQLGGNL